MPFGCGVIMILQVLLTRLIFFDYHFYVKVYIHGSAHVNKIYIFLWNDEPISVKGSERLWVFWSSSDKSLYIDEICIFL